MKYLLVLVILCSACASVGPEKTVPIPRGEIVMTEDADLASHYSCKEGHPVIYRIMRLGPLTVRCEGL